MDVAHEFKRALEHHQQGRLLEAGEIYREILARDPDHVDALNLMGVVLQAAGDLELAETLIRRATEVAPEYFAPFANLGNVVQAAGRLPEAIELFRKALDLNHDSFETWNNLASALNATEEHEAALGASKKALSIINDFPEALVNMGNAFLGMRQITKAVESYKKALDLSPRHPNALFNLGNAYMDLENFDAAIEPYRGAVQLDVGNAEKHFNLANALMKTGQFTESLKPFETAIALKPNYVDALCNYASSLQSLGRADQAMAHLQKALLSEPESPDLHWNLSLAALQNGDQSTGWAEYEWRWKMPTFADFKRDFSQPVWRGEALIGRSLFVHTEQGFGDNIQFCRYVQMVSNKGGRVILECRPELKRLFGTLDGTETLVTLGEVLPEFDFHIPLMSLPNVFGTTIDTVPSNVPYLSVPEEIDPDPRIFEANGFKVGLVWAGSPTRVDNQKRSLLFSDLEPLFDVPGIDFFSLQVGAGKDELKKAKTGLITDLTDNILDFADTASILSQLDLLISVDTSVLHLAGALAKPAWGAMSSPTGFLWMDDREDSPWYPSLRLFRQTKPGEWGPVILSICEALVLEKGVSDK